MAKARGILVGPKKPGIQAAIEPEKRQLGVIVSGRHLIPYLSGGLNSLWRQQLYVLPKRYRGFVKRVFKLSDIFSVALRHRLS